MSDFIIDNSISIEELNSNDNLELCKLFENAYNGTIDDKFINNMLERFINTNYKTYGYRYNKRLIAAVHIYIINTYAKLERIGVLSDKQNQGFGLSLLQDLLKLMKVFNIQTVELECRPILSYFYSKAGFEVIKIEEHHINRQGRDVGKIYKMKINLK